MSLVTLNKITMPGVARSTSRLALVGAGVLVLALAGCASQRTEPAALGMVSPEVGDRHPITLERAPVYLDLEVPRGARDLSPAQASAVRGFLARYRRDGESHITIAAPNGSRNESAAFRAVGKVRAIARELGIPRHFVHARPYSAWGQRNAPLKISYQKLVARGPECGNWPDNLADDPDNVPYHNLGCAQQANLAAMVANPRDLIGPGPMDPRSSERRDTIWGKYVKGEPTGAKRSKEEKSGNISEVAK